MIYSDNMISSFDIFDTCLIRKCGTPENFFDVFSLQAFNCTPQEWERQEFIVARRLTEQKLCKKKPHYNLQDIWNAFDWTHSSLKLTAELCQLEQDLESQMLVPVLSMRDKVIECRKRGDRIIFISDMYLSSEFLKSILRDHGFYLDGDSIYVSCECSAAKWNGDLFRYVKEKENLKSYRNWYHYGDNKISDYKVPKKIGIRCSSINHTYTPYQLIWKKSDFSLGVKYHSIIAGLSRALRYSTEWNSHIDFLVDIIAPFYCSWIYQVLENAQKRGIKRLYFCARDAYQIHKIALAMRPQFPNVEIEYVYMSRISLYNENNHDAKLAYYRQIGLATTKDDVAIVDTTTSGQTLKILNDFLVVNGYNEVTAYYYLLWNKVADIDRTKYTTQIYDQYVCQNKNFNRLLSCLFVFENFFGLSNDQKTIDYALNENGNALPIFSNELYHEDCRFLDNIDWGKIHEGVLSKYAHEYILLGMGRFSKEIFEHIGNSTVSRFFAQPLKQYLIALENFYFLGYGNSELYPCIKKILNPLELVGKKRKYYWRRGCIYYTLPQWIIRLITNQPCTNS